MEGKNKTIVITASLEIFEMFTEAVNTRLASDGTDSFQVLLDTGDFQRKLTEGALEAEKQWRQGGFAGKHVRGTQAGNF